MYGYTPYQIEDALIRQGYDPAKAQYIAYSLGDNRVSPEDTERLYKKIGADNLMMPQGKDGRQDSSFSTNLLEGLGVAGGEALLPRALAAGIPGAKYLPMVGAVAANLGQPYLFDNNFYERASAPQLLADLAGSYVGAKAGLALGKGMQDSAKAYKAGLAPYEEALKNARYNVKVMRGLRAGNGMLNAANAASGAARSKLEDAAIKSGVGKVLGKLGSRALGAGATRLLAGALGAAGGPLGMIAGTALGGYLLPKLLGSGSKEVNEDSGQGPVAGGGWAGLGGIAGGLALASPKARAKLGEIMPDILKNTRKEVSDRLPTYEDFLKGWVPTSLHTPVSNAGQNYKNLAGTLRRGYADTPTTSLEQTRLRRQLENEQDWRTKYPDKTPTADDLEPGMFGKMGNWFDDTVMYPFSTEQERIAGSIQNLGRGFFQRD